MVRDSYDQLRYKPTFSGGLKPKHLFWPRTGNNEGVTLGFHDSERPDPGPLGESSAWDAVKRFVDPPMGSFGREDEHQADPQANSDAAHEAATAAGSSPSPEQAVLLSEVQPSMEEVPESVAVPTATTTLSGESLKLATEVHADSIAPVAAVLPVKPQWPDEDLAVANQHDKKKRRRGPILLMAGLVLGGAVVALAQTSVLPASLRRTLHLGPASDAKSAAKNASGSTKAPGPGNGSEVSDTTVPPTRPKRELKGYDPTMRAALSSVDRFWAKQFPAVYDEEYKKLRGGVYAYSSDSRIPPCDGTNLPYLILQQNAFYCPEGDFIAWDDQGLFPRLEKKYGRFLLTIVLAHEWGHAVQERADGDLDTITAEQQADCFAGSWAASLDSKTEPELTKLRDTELDKALSGFIEFRDLVGMVSTDPGAHGTAFDRIRAFQDGFEGTPATCARYEEEVPELVAIPYRSFKERFRGGNLPYPEVLPSITKELAVNWKSVFSTDPVSTIQAKDFPVCFAQPVSPEGYDETTISFCQDDRTLRFSEKSMRTLYDRIGDFGPATTIGIGWAMADLVAEGKDPNSKTFWVEANCRAGAWAGTMFDSDDPGNSQLSPGDLDESVRTILEASDKGAAKVFGTGFEQVSAFREGVLHGLSDCQFLQPPA